MNTEKQIEEKISRMLGRNRNAGLAEPPLTYFEHFAENLSLKKDKESKNQQFNIIRQNWLKISSYGVAAFLLLALWFFIFDAGIKKDTNVAFTMDELMALNDFQNYNEDLIYSELALHSDVNFIANDPEVDVILDFNNITTNEILELYSIEDIK